MPERRGNSLKAAFQLSLGFIVAVVFAVILLSLAITWLNQIMGDIGGLTNDLTQKASQKLDDIFSETDQTFAVWPSEYTVKRGTTLKTLVGIINRQPDSQEHDFSIYVKSNNNVDDWIDKSAFENERFTVQFNKDLKIPITITPKRDAPKGTYTFWIYACIDTSSCSDSNYNYESPQYIRIILE